MSIVIRREEGMMSGNIGHKVRMIVGKEEIKDMTDVLLNRLEYLFFLLWRW